MVQQVSDEEQKPAGFKRGFFEKEKEASGCFPWPPFGESSRPACVRGGASTTQQSRAFARKPAGFKQQLCSEEGGGRR